MHKIPVGETISGAYGFAIGEFLSVLGTAWFPFVVWVALSAALIFGVTPDLPAHILRGEFDMSVLREAARVGGIIALLSYIARAMVTVGLQRKAQGLHPGPVYFYFSLARPVWLVIAALFLAALLIILNCAITLGVIVAVALASVKLGGLGKALAAIVGVAGVCWMVYASVRLIFFLPAVVVAEDRIGLGRAWELGGGNFWRIVGTLLVIFIPASIAIHIVSSALAGPFIMPMSFHWFGTQMTPDQAAALYTDFIRETLRQLRAAWPVLVLIEIIQTVIYLGLGNGAIAKAYLAVTGKVSAA